MISSSNSKLTLRQTLGYWVAATTGEVARTTVLPHKEVARVDARLSLCCIAPRNWIFVSRATVAMMDGVILRVGRLPAG